MASKCRYCGDDHNQRATVDRELLIQLEDFLDDRADVMDGDYGEPRPNRAMQLLQDVRAVLEGSSEGTGAILHPVSPLSSFSTTGAEEPSGTTPRYCRCDDRHLLVPADPDPPVADLGKPANASLPEPAARPQEGGSAPTCSRCRGTGEETHHEGGDAETDWCSDCGGTGEPLLPDYVTPLRKLAAELGVKK